ncbi:hypothetical protein PIB30_086241 [Stylosanthes scabra]|uniref:Uncharacterized protein n=1 Tax=Stylosanthes scabra TaxID=79078 RepID=A0ABU6QU89_9FABA|nr:hypothetical protein [Stylosanthes scabra]
MVKLLLLRPEPDMRPEEVEALLQDAQHSSIDANSAHGSTRVPNMGVVHPSDGIAAVVRNTDGGVEVIDGIWRSESDVRERLTVASNDTYLCQHERSTYGGGMGVVGSGLVPSVGEQREERHEFDLGELSGGLGSSRYMRALSTELPSEKSDVCTTMEEDEMLVGPQLHMAIGWRLMQDV